MGADLHLDPPLPPPREHVVVNTDTMEVFGPYTEPRARRERMKILKKTGWNRDHVVVRKMIAEHP